MLLFSASQYKRQTPNAIKHLFKFHKNLEFYFKLYFRCIKVSDLGKSLRKGQKRPKKV